MVGAVLVEKPGQQDVTWSQILFTTGTWKLLWFALASITNLLHLRRWGGGFGEKWKYFFQFTSAEHLPGQIISPYTIYLFQSFYLNSIS